MRGNSPLGVLARSIGSLLIFSAPAFASATAQTPNDYELSAKLMVAPISVNEKGLSKFNAADWTLDSQSDGTELYTLKKSDGESRAAVMRNISGALESITTYQVKGKTENSAVMFFSDRTLSGFTKCEDPTHEATGEKDVGRVCVTATPTLCHALKAGTVSPDTMKDMDTLEMRALAILLTLRGTDHQLENMVRSGNRLGLKSALQTTKGQLMMAAKLSSERKPSAQSDLIAKSILDRSLPRLKQACLDTHFN